MSTAELFKDNTGGGGGGHPLLNLSPHHLSPYRCILLLIVREVEKEWLLRFLIPLGVHSHGVQRQGLLEDRAFEVLQDPGDPLRVVPY